MLNQSKLEVKFESFKDGIVKLYNLNDDGTLQKEPTAVQRFGNRIVGESQFYTAMAAQKKISRRIRIPMFSTVDEDNADTFNAVIGNSIYSITRAQHYPEKNPPVTDLTLNFVRERK